MTGRGQLLADLERVARNCCRLCKLVSAEDLGFRPAAHLASLAELSNQIAQSLVLDLRIVTGATEDEVRALEDSLWHEDAGELCSLLKEGYGQVRRYMEELTFEAYENGSMTAFYGRTQTNAQWLLEMLTRLYHQRGQLYLYLKLLDYPVSGATLNE